MLVQKVRHVWKLDPQFKAVLEAQGERDVDTGDEVLIRHEATNPPVLFNLVVTADEGIEYRLNDVITSECGGRYVVETAISVTRGSGLLRYSYSLNGGVFGKDELSGVALCLQDADGTPLTYFHLQVNLPEVRRWWMVLAEAGWIPTTLDDLMNTPAVVRKYESVPSTVLLETADEVWINSYRRILAMEDVQKGEVVLVWQNPGK